MVAPSATMAASIVVKKSIRVLQAYRESCPDGGTFFFIMRRRRARRFRKFCHVYQTYLPQLALPTRVSNFHIRHARRRLQDPKIIRDHRWKARERHERRLQARLLPLPLR